MKKKADDMALPGEYYSVHPDTIHVDNWNVNEDFIFHKHPELGKLSAWPDDGLAELEWALQQDRCTYCKKKVPDEIKFIHSMYQL